MPRLIWSPSALLDVQRLYHFLASKNLDAAKRALMAIRQGVRVLEQKSELGRPVEDMDDECRDWIIDFGDSGYVARYRIGLNAVVMWLPSLTLPKATTSRYLERCKPTLPQKA
jgi:plasmid stabilization system protein ParE